MVASSCRPAKGNTYLTIGQDLFSIEEYVLSQYNASLHQGSTKPMTSFHPSGTMFYTDLQRLRGVMEPIDYGSGIEFALGLVQAFPNSSLQIGLWLSGADGCHDIVAGKLDSQIHKLFSTLQSLETPKVFLRVGYEFDNPSFGYSSDPGAYRHAFRYMVQACQEQLGVDCHDKIAFCWHSWAAPKVAPLADFYPGDDVVDWVGISIFQQVFPWAEDNSFAGGNRKDLVEVLDFAQAREKPVMIAESTPFGGFHWQDHKNPGMLLPWTSAMPSPWHFNQTQFDLDLWTLWFEATLELIEEYDIGMWCYINCDWNSQPMWHGIGFGDTRLSSSPVIMKRWREHVLQSPRFQTSIDCQAEQDKMDAAGSMTMLVSGGWSKPTGLQSVTAVQSWLLVALLALVGLLVKRSRVQRGQCPQESDQLTDTPECAYGSI